MKRNSCKSEMKINKFPRSAEVAPEIWRQWKMQFIRESTCVQRSDSLNKKLLYIFRCYSFSKTLTRTFCFHLPFQVILFCSWIFSVIFNIPLFLARTYERKDGTNHCVLSWPEKWMSTASCLSWVFLIVTAIGLMITLYSQVVCSLWLKPKSCFPLSFEQQVRA